LNYTGNLDFEALNLFIESIDSNQLFVTYQMLPFQPVTTWYKVTMLQFQSDNK